MANIVVREKNVKKIETMKENCSSPVTNYLGLLLFKKKLYFNFNISQKIWPREI